MKKKRKQNKGRLPACFALALCLWTAGIPAARAADAPPDAVTFDAPEDAAPGTFGAYGTTAGTVILIGAGAYTFVRTKKKEKKPEQEYVYFENHTKRERDKL